MALDEVAHYGPRHQDLRCLQSQLHVFSSLVLKELTGHLLVFWIFWVIPSHQELSKLRLDVIDVCTHETHVFRTRTKQNKCSAQNNQIFNNNTHFFTILQLGLINGLLRVNIRQFFLPCLSLVGRTLLCFLIEKLY